MNSKLAIASLIALSFCVEASAQVNKAVEKPRVVVTTDPELDDSNSLLRYFLYSDEFDTLGLIYASSRFHWKGDGKGTKFAIPGRSYLRYGKEVCPCTEWRWGPEDLHIDQALDVYEKAYPNLKVQDRSFPTPASLRSKVRFGNVEFEGDISKDTPGSDLIKSLLLDDKPGPLYLLAWGGGSTIARALRSIQLQYQDTPQWAAIRDKVSRKAVIQAFGDQDLTYESYIKPNWPNLEFRAMATRTYGYGARGAVLPQDQVYLTGAWTQQNILSKGPMGDHYRVWGDGKTQKGDPFDFFGMPDLTVEKIKAMGFESRNPIQEKGAWISEGDTSTFMNLIQNGLRGNEKATYGGWGGRSGVDSGPNGPDPNYASARFFGAAQRDLASRFQWTVSPRFKDANHPPVVAVEGNLNRTVHPGEKVVLSGRASDPDGNKTSMTWWQYVEAGSYAGRVPTHEDGPGKITLNVPADAHAGDTIHMILEAKDDTAMPLSRYQRVILTVAR